MTIATLEQHAKTFELLQADIEAACKKAETLGLELTFQYKRKPMEVLTPQEMIDTTAMELGLVSNVRTIIRHC